MEKRSTKPLMYNNISGEKFGEMDKLALNVLLDYGYVTFPLDIIDLAKKNRYKSYTIFRIKSG